MFGREANLRARSDFHQFAKIHDADARRDMLDDRDRVRNKKVGQSELLLQICQQIDDLCLNRYIESRHRLVRHNQFRFQCQSSSDADSLPLAAAEFVWIAAHHRRIQSNGLQKIGDTVFTLGSAGQSVNREWLADNRPDGHSRIQRGVRILKDDLHVAPLAA